MPCLVRPHPKHSNCICPVYCILSQTKNLVLPLLIENHNISLNSLPNDILVTVSWLPVRTSNISCFFNCGMWIFFLSTFTLCFKVCPSLWKLQVLQTVTEMQMYTSSTVKFDVASIYKRDEMRSQSRGLLFGMYQHFTVITFHTTEILIQNSSTKISLIFL